MTRKGMGPPKRRLRIQSRKRFILFVLVILLVILVLFIPSKTDGHVAYKPYKVGYGDTYWGIARQLQNDGYRSGADIRDVVYELIEKSGIKAHELKDGNTIFIPDLGE